MARSSPPAGKEIAEQARQLRFDDTKSVEAFRSTDNVHVRFAPTHFDRPKSKDEAEAGIVVGRADVQLGDYQGQYKAKLKSGKYHLFIAKVGEAWKGYAELNGTIPVEAKEVMVEVGTSPADIKQDKPTIEFGSICIQRAVRPDRRVVRCL